MKKHDPAMAVCPDCGSRLVVSGRVGHSEVYSRRYLCGAIYHDERLDNSTEVCREIERLRAELLNRIGWHRRYSDGLEEVLRDVREYKKSGEVVRSDREEVKRLVVKIKRLRVERLDAARSGYMAGHNDTVEGQYGDPGDIAVEICEELDRENDQ